jgi:hypothetical protein
MAAEVSVVNDDGTLKLLRLLRAYVKEGVSNAEARKGLMVVAGEHLRRLPPLGQRARELSKALATVQEPKSRPSNQFWLVATLRSSEDEKQTWLHSTLTDFKDGSDAPRDRAAVVVPVRQILERLEMATNDSWPATSERRVKHYPGPESALSARQLVDQAFKEYEKAERNREPGSPDSGALGDGHERQLACDIREARKHSTLTDFKDGSGAPRDRAAVVVLERLGAPSKTRTCDLLVRSQTLYPTELWARRGRPHPHYQHGHERYETVTISQDKTAVRRARFGRSRLGKREPANAFQAAGCL